MSLPPSTPGGDPNAVSVSQAGQLAVQAYRRGDWAEAERQCRLILGAEPGHFDALNMLGIVAVQTRRSQEAVEFLSRAALLRPGSAEVHSNLGNVLHGLGRHDEALARYDRALAINPGYAPALNNRGHVLRELKRHDEALASFDAALRIRPDHAEAMANRGVALRDLKRHGEALASFDRALAIKPAYAEALCHRGVALCDLDRHAEALESFDRALAIKPDYAQAQNNRGVALCRLERPAEALACYDRALAIDPRDAEALNNRGNALCELKRYDEALASYERALSLAPDDANAHWNLSMCQLRLGDFARGFAEYEWRWKQRQWQTCQRDFAAPLWLGEEPLAGRTILLHHEQGLGDTLQFSRYAKCVAALGAKVLLLVEPPLWPLFTGLDGAVEVLATGAALPPFDCHCPLLSLPLALKTTLDSIPAAFPNLRADAARVRAWQETLGPATGPRIGLVWSGNARFKNDHTRSLALAQALPLVGHGAEWVSLQKEVRPADAALLASRTDLRHYGDRLGDFADTAALVELMDLVVTSDTSVAHLVGTMGKPVWILLSFNADWRWLLDRADSPWYPSARLFRQSAIGDWASVIERVRAELSRYSQGTETQMRVPG